MFRMLIAILLIWLLFTFTAEVLAGASSLIAMVMDHVQVTIS